MNSLNSQKFIKQKKKMIKNEKDKLEKKKRLRKPNCQHGCKIWKTDKRNFRTKNFKILRTHFDFIKQTQSLTEKKTLERLKTLDASNEVSRTIEYQFRNNDDIKVPPMAQVSMATFIPKPIDSDRLHSLTGEMVPLSRAIGGNIMSPETPNCSDRRLPDGFEIVAKL